MNPKSKTKQQLETIKALSEKTLKINNDLLALRTPDAIIARHDDDNPESTRILELIKAMRENSREQMNICSLLFGKFAIAQWRNRERANPRPKQRIGRPSKPKPEIRPHPDARQCLLDIKSMLDAGLLLTPWHVSYFGANDVRIAVRHTWSVYKKWAAKRYVVPHLSAASFRKAIATDPLFIACWRVNFTDTCEKVGVVLHKKALLDLWNPEPEEDEDLDFSDFEL